MSNKVPDLIFPLKERVRGNLKLSKKLLQDNIAQLSKDMLSLKEEFGIRTYDRDGNRIFLDVWQVGKKQPNTAPQLRWRVTNKTGKFFFTMSLAEIILNEKKNFEKLIRILLSIQNLPIYDEIISTDIKRVQINARNKASYKMLQHIYEIEQSLLLEKILKNYKIKMIGLDMKNTDLFD